jgi:hypothetical protein
MAQQWQRQGRQFAGLAFGPAEGASIGQYVRDLEVRIEKGGGQMVGSAKGRISGWIVARSSESTMLWDTRLRDIPFEAKSSYAISIRFSGVAPDARKLTFVPILEGGGIAW